MRVTLSLPAPRPALRSPPSRHEGSSHPGRPQSILSARTVAVLPPSTLLPAQSPEPVTATWAVRATLRLTAPYALPRPARYEIPPKVQERQSTSQDRQSPVAPPAVPALRPHARSDASVRHACPRLGRGASLSGGQSPARSTSHLTQYIFRSPTP